MAADQGKSEPAAPSPSPSASARQATQLRTLGRSGVRVTALSLGTAAIGNLFAPVADDEAVRTIAAALDAGIGYIDTAPHYGAGLAEERVGRAVAGRERTAFTLSTKVGRLLRPAQPGEQPADEGFVDAHPLARQWDFTADGIRRSIEESLERLGLDRVDIAYLHDPDEHEREVYETAYPALAKLRAEGVVGAIGAGMNQSGMLTRLVRELDLDAVLCAGRYTLLDRSAAADLLPECARRGTSVVIGGVYNSGLLADPKPGATFDYVPAASALVNRALKLKEACAGFGVPLSAAAVQFPAREATVASVLVGCRNEQELRENIAMFEYPLPDALWPVLDAIATFPGSLTSTQRSTATS